MPTNQPKNVNSELIKNHVDSIILSTLVEGDKYGLEIINEIKQKSNNLYSIKNSTFYNILKRMCDNNWISSYNGDESNGAQRLYYKIEQAGIDIVNTDKYQWEFSRTILDKLLSNKEFDANTTPPFTEEELKPASKRTKSDNQETNNSYLNQNMQYNAFGATTLPQEEKNRVNYVDFFDKIIKNTIAPFEDTQEKSVYYEEMSMQEMILKYRKDGINIKPYYRNDSNTFINNKFFAKNKVNALSAIIAFIIFSCTLVLYNLFIYNDMSWHNFAIIIGVSAIFPLLSAVKWIANPMLRSENNNKIYPKLLAWLILFINCAMICCLLAYFIFSIDFSVVNDIIKYIIAPCCLLLIVPIYIFIQYCITKSKLFIIK